MAIRKQGSKDDGSGFSDAEKLAVWKKAQIVQGWDGNVSRLDSKGARIDWDKYGDTTPGGFGWEVDHIVPVVKKGRSVTANLQPLQWQNNRLKSDDDDNLQKEWYHQP
jgi:hypothetical protein